jgi:uncharacterized protein YfaS (alpha-2-macroglobulin family)
MENRRLTALLLVLTAAAPASARGRFYLSTQGIAAPGEQPVVSIEAKNVDALSMRVYRLSDPQKFLLEQRDLHRPVTANTLKGKHLFQVLTGGYRAAAVTLREQLRDGWSAKARHKALSSLSQANEGLSKAEKAPVKKQIRIPPLKDLPLVSYWREQLSKTDDNGDATEGEAPPEESGDYGGTYNGMGDSGSGWDNRTLALGVSEPGVYLVEGVNDEDVGYTLAVVSRVGLMVKQGPDRTVCLAVDQSTGAALPGTKVTLFNQGKPYAQGETDGDGLFVAEAKTPSETFVVAQNGADVALVDPAFYSASATNRTVYLFTDRPVYRPGHDVHFKGLLRTLEGSSYALPKPGTAKVSLLDAQGSEQESVDAEISAKGSFSGQFTLPEKSSDPKPGVWRLRAVIDGETFDGEFKLKEFTKPEYRVEIALDKPAYLAGDTVKGTINARFFHGGALKAGDVQYTIYKSRFFVPEFSDAEADYFVSEGERTSAGREIIKEERGTLDATGALAFSFEAGKDAQDFTYSIEAKVKDRAGKTVSATRAVDVTVGRFYLSANANKLVYEPGEEVSLTVRARDYGDRPVATAVEVSMEQSRRDKDQVVDKTLPSQSLSLAAEPKGGVNRFKATEAGAYLATLTAKDDAGSLITTTVPFFVTAKGGDLPMAKGGLELYADKSSYRIGDDALILVRAPFDSASVLVTHEGMTLLSKEVLPLKGYSAVLRFKVTGAMSPNVFVGAMAISAGRTFRRELVLAVPPVEKLLKVSVDSDKPLYTPGQEGTFTVTVKGHDGTPVANAEVALSIVDEAIYAVSPELAPGLPEFFFSPVRDNVRGTSSTTFRFYGYGRNVREQMSQRLLRGRTGFGDLKALSSKVRKEFKDTLSFSPTLATGPDGKATVKVTFPENLTTWRATARVITDDTRVGAGVGKARVNQEFQVRVAAPRFFRDRDEVTLGVLVDNGSDTKGTVTVMLDAKGLELEVKQQTLEVAPGNQAVAVFPAKVNGAGGKVTLRASGKLGSLSDATQLEVPRLPHGAVITVAQNGSLESASSDPAELSLEIPEGANPGSTRVALYASTGIGPAIEGALDYLVGYPYGCTEQTMSRFVPDLVAVKAYEKLKIKNSRKDELPKMVTAGLSRLRQLQHNDGGWGWWEEDQSDGFMTGYVVQGLAMAKLLGFGGEAIDEMLGKGVKRLTEFASNESSDTLRAYLLYGLSAAGSLPGSMLGALSKQTNEGGLSAYGKSMVVLALAESGKKELALAAAESLEKSAVEDGATVRFGGSKDEPWWQQRGQGAVTQWENDPIESTAVALRALVKVKPDSKFIDGSVRYLLSQRLDGHWQSTRDTAVVVAALADVLPRLSQVAAGAKVTATANGKPFGEKTLKEADLYAPEVLVGELSNVPSGKNLLSVTRSGGSGHLFLAARASYLDNGEHLKASSVGMKVVRKYKKVASQPDASGNLRETATAISSENPVVGQDELLLVELEVTAPTALEYLMLEDPLCSGCEVEENDTGRSPSSIDLHPPGLHREVHDERVMFFARRIPAGKSVFAYLATPGLGGLVHVMPTTASLMYHPQVRATSDEVVLNVGGEE